MSKKNQKSLRHLETFLADTAGQTKEEIVAELKAEGVNIDQFLQDVETIVRKGYQGELKSIAAEERDARNSPDSLFGDIASKTTMEVQELFAKIKNGVFGEDLRQAALARCRNQVDDKVSEAELRSWLEDIESSVRNGK